MASANDIHNIKVVILRKKPSSPDDDKLGALSSLPSSILAAVPRGSDATVLNAEISRQISVNPAQIRLVLAGTPLSNDLPLSSANIGPETAVHAVISSCQIHGGKQETPSHPVNGGESALRSYFYVFCKSGCEELRRGKLRVRCSLCKSPAVLLREEPGCWNDVLSVPHLSCLCYGDSACENSVAEFFFKCTHCSEKDPSAEVTAVPLTQVKSNTDSSPCETCGEVNTPVFHFSCQLPHKICVDCFVGYATVNLNDRGFGLSETAGYTLFCPVAGCGGCVRDAHAFRLLGSQLYRKYQKFATENYILRNNGVFCPRPNCGNGFLVDSDADVILLVCPSCGFSFCRNCTNSASDCSCDASAQASGSKTVASADSLDVEKSLATIRKVCKQCPRCRVKTERDGGCHHMSCRQCGFNGCWQCVREWSDECQWDHWFD